ncbi:DMT family transporter [Ferroglobus sp.]|uniref:DMT family transporter n=1 Tax=Ferroglobus sp. TaxID=2614230 RepID=UPI0025BA3769|nr:DMT family transporter [Ferroglobus sp.]
MIKHYALLSLAVLSVSSASIFVVLANAPGSVTAFWRLFFSVLILLAFTRSIRTPKRSEVVYPIVAGTALAIHFSSWMQSLFYASVAVSTTIVCTHAIFSAVFSSFFGERPKLSQVIGVVIAIVGVYFLSGADPSSKPEGIILALVGALAGGVYFTLGRFSRSKIDFESYVLFTYATAALVSFAISYLIKLPLFGYPLKTWIFFVLLAAIPMMLGHTLINYLLRRMKVVPVTASIIGEAVGAAFLAWIVLGQALDAKAYLSMILVLFGIGIAVRTQE